MGLTDEDVREILRIIDSCHWMSCGSRPRGSRCTCARAGRAAAATLRSRSRPSRRRRPPDPPAPPPADEGLIIASPMLGTFYRAEGPGRPPFVEVGSRVEPETTVGIVEVMKMMNSVPAGVTGVIEEVCAENAQLVEYGQPLFRVRGEP